MVVLAAYSPSAQGDAALVAAVREAILLQQEIVVASHLFNDSNEGPGAASEAEVNEALARLSRTFTHAERAYLETLEVKVLSSDDPQIANFVIAQAERLNASVLILGLRHASIVSRMSLGAVVKKILLDSPCPVLVAKA